MTRKQRILNISGERYGLVLLVMVYVDPEAILDTAELPDGLNGRDTRGGKYA
jgi:hypothetical protein